MDASCILNGLLLVENVAFREGHSYFAGRLQRSARDLRSPCARLVVTCEQGLHHNIEGMEHAYAAL